MKPPLCLIAVVILGVTAALAWQATTAHLDVRRIDLRRHRQSHRYAGSANIGLPEGITGKTERSFVSVALA